MHPSALDVSAVVESANRRLFQRIHFDADVRLYSDRAMWPTRLLDISLKGALVERPENWDAPVGKIQRLEIRMHQTLVISVNAHIAHVTPTNVGYRFQRIDLDSFVRLKRLIELNLGDPNLLNRELSNLV